MKNITSRDVPITSQFKKKITKRLLLLVTFLFIGITGFTQVVSEAATVCDANLYVSNNANIPDGFIDCTSAADTGGAVIDANVVNRVDPLDPFNSDVCNYGVADLNVQWVQMAVAQPYNGIKMQIAQGAYVGYAAYAANGFVGTGGLACPDLELTFLGCYINNNLNGNINGTFNNVDCTSSPGKPSWQCVVDPSGGQEDATYFYVAIYYLNTNGTINVKTKE